MKKLIILTSIGSIAGVILAVFLLVTQEITGSTAYVLLFEVDYIPLLKSLRPVYLVEATFHFGTCIASTIVLYYFFKLFHLEKSVSAYVIIIFIGSGFLYFLTIFSPQTPLISDLYSWAYWTIGHIIFSMTIGGLIKRWL